MYAATAAGVLERPTVGHLPTIPVDALRRRMGGPLVALPREEPQRLYRPRTHSSTAVARMVCGWLGLDWGNVPTWIGTVVTSSSFTIAALSYRRSVLDRERDQARNIAAWIARQAGRNS